MAILTRIDENGYEERSWLVWAIELMRRGLKPLDEIEVHGPHGIDADFMWGEAKCSYLWGGTTSVYVEFRSARTNSKWLVKGVRVRTDDHGEYYPIIKAKNLPEEWRKEIYSMKAELREKDQRRGWAHLQ